MSLSSFLDEPELNEFQKAFYSGDKKRIKEVCEQFKVPKEQVVFKIIDEILVGKRRMQVNEISEYDQVFINTALSQHTDLIFYAENMNKLIGPDRQEFISNQMHFDYLWAIVRRGKRPRVKWAKSKSSEDLLIIACMTELFQISKEKATEYFRDLSNEKITIIKSRSKSFASNESFLKSNFAKTQIAELQAIANKW